MKPEMSAEITSKSAETENAGEAVFLFLECRGAIEGPFSAVDVCDRAAKLVLRGVAFDVLTEAGARAVWMDQRGMMGGDRVFRSAVLDRVHEMKYRVRYLKRERAEQTDGAISGF